MLREAAAVLAFVAVFSLKRPEQSAQMRKRRGLECLGCDSSISLSGLCCQLKKLWLLLAEAWKRFETT